MNYAEKERATLGFTPYEGSGSVEETFYPWNLTAERFVEEGISRELTDRALYYKDPADSSLDEQKKMYFVVTGSRGVMEYEHSLGFDPVLRIGFNLPFCRTVPEVLGESEGTLTRRNVLGKIVCRDKSSGLEREIHNPVESQADWEALKEYGKKQLDLLYTDEILEEVYGPYVAAHEAGDYSLRMNIEGFFWVPRDLLGIEEHLFAFYDEPELIHDMCQSILEIYTTKLLKVVDMLKPDVLYISEDLSGANGPMISPAFFDEFIASYYKQLIPLLKQHGVGLVFVDTDGDFNALIPQFMEAGVEGFLPMDVNAGMDIVKVREKYPLLKFIGGYNKLCIAEGAKSIDAEFDRILPVIRRGGYIPGADHQVQPSVSLSDYRYYIQKLHEIMMLAGKG